ncbi:MAG: phosphoribosylanthranilate isomerase [Rhodocyclales bacterium]|nr:phosphoribosylanthranilate isomerase [Rhodocyclales bacterium]
MTRTRIKICGITREEDLVAAVAAGADALGFVFYAPSPRYVTPELAAQLVAHVPPFVTRVGLFVNERAQTVRTVLAQVPLDLLQFHGDEDAAYCSQFGRPWIKAARVKPGFDLLEYALAFAQAPGVSGLLLDADVEGYGGGGKTFDWGLAVRPWAVDVSSGVEAARGIKDAQKITEFIAGVRDADAGPSL